MAIDINKKHYYKNDEFDGRTKERLQEISDLGLEEVGLGEFGIKGLMSGLYIERVWSYDAEQWQDYVEWIRSLKKQ